MSEAERTQYEMEMSIDEDGSSTSELDSESESERLAGAGEPAHSTPTRAAEQMGTGADATHAFSSASGITQGGTHVTQATLAHGVHAGERGLSLSRTRPSRGHSGRPPPPLPPQGVSMSMSLSTAMPAASNPFLTDDEDDLSGPSAGAGAMAGAGARGLFGAGVPGVSGASKAGGGSGEMRTRCTNTGQLPTSTPLQNGSGHGHSSFRRSFFH